MAEVTKSYKKFKFLLDNRETDTAHINRLKDAIEKNPKILEVQPILVNENFEIIDGQHRFTAAQELKLPIHYTVVRGLDINTARQMNVLQKRWGLTDYAQSFAKAGNIHYKAYLKYKEEHPSLAGSIIYHVMAGGHSEEVSAKFKSGQFVAGRSVEDIEWVLGKLEEMREITGHEIPVSRNFVAAVCNSIDNNEDFDLTVVISNLRLKPEMFHRTSVVKEALRMLEDMHNYNKKTNLIRLY